MTVGELIERLQTLDPDLRVLVDGYEDGYDDPSLREVDVIDWQGEDKGSWWTGRYEQVDSFTSSLKAPVRALVLQR